MRSAWESSCCKEQPAGFYRNTETGFNTLNGQVLMSVFNKKTKRNTARESLSRAPHGFPPACQQSAPAPWKIKIIENNKKKKPFRDYSKRCLWFHLLCNVHILKESAHIFLYNFTPGFFFFSPGGTHPYQAAKKTICGIHICTSDKMIRLKQLLS